MSSMLGLLAEYGIWPRVLNASVISDNLKVSIVWNTSISVYVMINCMELSCITFKCYLSFSLSTNPMLWFIKEADLVVSNLNMLCQNHPKVPCSASMHYINHFSHSDKRLYGIYCRWNLVKLYYNEQFLFFIYLNVLKADVWMKTD